MFLSANLYRVPKASHRYRDVFFPWPHLVFSDDVFAEFYVSIGKPPSRASWVNQLSVADHCNYFNLIGFETVQLSYAKTPIDEASYRRNLETPDAIEAGVGDIDRAVELKRYVHHLWSGLSQPAVRELERVLRDPAYAPDQRFASAHELATWYAFAGDHEAALRAIQSIDQVAPDHRDAKLRWMKEGFIRLARAEPEAARACFEHFLQTCAERTDPDAILALAATEAEATRRLAWISEALEQAGYAGIEPIDPSRMPNLDNIRGRPVACRSGDLGRVSVIIPAYRAADTIATALRSLIEQSYHNLEIIVVDDRSPDGTAEVVAAFARADARIRLMRQDANGGAYVARNRGLAEASGDFITTHDADDWSHPQKIETQMACLAECPGAIGSCSAWVRVYPDLRMSPGWRIRRPVLHRNYSSFLFRRRILDEIGSWDPVRICADSELISRVQAARGRGAVKDVARNVPLAFGRDAEGSLTRAKATHARTLHFGLRQIYWAAWVHSHASKLPVAEATRQRLRATAPELYGDTSPITLEYMLIGDCASPVVVAEMRNFVEESGPDTPIGLFHWPDFSAVSSFLCPAYCVLLERPNVRAVLPNARVVLPRRYGMFFGAGHAEIDEFPAIEISERVSAVDRPSCSRSRATGYSFTGTMAGY